MRMFFFGMPLSSAAFEMAGNSSGWVIRNLTLAILVACAYSSANPHATPECVKTCVQELMLGVGWVCASVYSSRCQQSEEEDGIVNVVQAVYRYAVAFLQANCFEAGC